MSDTQEVFVGAFSFGGGIGGECFEAANLNTLREAKREDDEVGCFWADPELLVVAIRRWAEGGEGGKGSDVRIERVSSGRMLYGA